MSRLAWTLEVYRSPDLPTLGARLRWFWHRHIRRYETEICHECGRPVARGIATWWHAPDELWQSTPLALERGVLCPACFASAADGLVYFLAQRDGASNTDSERSS